MNEKENNLDNGRVGAFDDTKIKPLIEYYYEEFLNYKECSVGSKVLFIFFTSNGLWDVSNQNSFIHRVISQDHYDYYNVTQSKYFSSKRFDSLFVRDIYLSWYAFGINTNINSQAELSAFLINYVKKYDEVITVGSSAGGYAAILFGTQINANRIFVFGPQNDLVGHLGFYQDSEIYSYFDVNSGKLFRIYYH